MQISGLTVLYIFHTARSYKMHIKVGIGAALKELSPQEPVHKKKRGFFYRF